MTKRNLFTLDGFVQIQGGHPHFPCPITRLKVINALPARNHGELIIRRPWPHLDQCSGSGGGKIRRLWVPSAPMRHTALLRT